MKAAEFRKLALAQAEAVEASHMNHPDFRIGGKIFASLGAPSEDWGMVKLTPDQQKRFLEMDADAFQPCSGAWGKSGCTNVRLVTAKKGDVQMALELAAENVVKKKSSSKTTRAAASTKLAPKKKKSKRT